MLRMKLLVKKRESYQESPILEKSESLMYTNCWKQKGEKERKPLMTGFRRLYVIEQRSHRIEFQVSYGMKPI